MDLPVWTIFRYEGKPSCATVKSTPFTVRQDEWDTKYFSYHLLLNSRTLQGIMLMCRTITIIVATLIAEILFEQFLIHNAVQRVEHS